MSLTNSGSDPWVALARSRLSALTIGGRFPSRVDLELELASVQRTHALLSELWNTSTYVPLLSLPDELIADIMLRVRDLGLEDYVRPCSDGSHRAVATWYAISQVCCRLRNVALATPALWTTTSDVYGSRLLLEFLPRSKDMALRLYLQCTPTLDQDTRDRVVHLRLSGADPTDTEGALQQLAKPFPALETLHITSGYTGGFLPFIPAESVPPRLHSLFISQPSPFPWNCPVYDGLTNLVLEDIYVGEMSFTLSQVQNLFARMIRVEKIVTRNVDIRDVVGGDVRVELPPRLHLLQLHFGGPLHDTQRLYLPLHIQPRQGATLHVSLSDDVLAFRPTYQRQLFTEHMFDRPGHCASTLRMQITLVQRPKMRYFGAPNEKWWCATLSYWSDSSNPYSSPPYFEMQACLDNVHTDKQDLQLDLQRNHISTLLLCLAKPQGEVHDPDLSTWSDILLSLSAVRVVRTTPHTLACVLKDSEHYPTVPIGSHQFVGLITLHLESDLYDGAAKALDNLKTIARWLRARKDIELGEVNTNVDPKLSSVLGGGSLEALLE